jgi:hypothetical protein
MELNVLNKRSTWSVSLVKLFSIIIETVQGIRFYDSNQDRDAIFNEKHYLLVFDKVLAQSNLKLGNRANISKLRCIVL